MDLASTIAQVTGHVVLVVAAILATARALQHRGCPHCTGRGRHTPGSTQPDPDPGSRQPWPVIGVAPVSPGYDNSKLVRPTPGSPQDGASTEVMPRIGRTSA